jgi:hypothetical protein
MAHSDEFLFGTSGASDVLEIFVLRPKLREQRGVQRWSPDQEQLMTPEEKSLLNDFLARLGNAGAVQADPEAAMFIARAGEQNPAALYLSIQRAVWLEHALQQAQARIQTLEAASTTPAGGQSSWLATTWGSGADNGRAVLPPEQSAAGLPYGATSVGPGSLAPYAQAGGAAVGQPYQNYAAPQPAPFGRAGAFGAGSSFLGGGGSLLATVATTAAGVAVGALVADALTSGHHHGARDSLADSTVPPAEPLVDSTDTGSLGDFDAGGDDGGFSDS